MWHFYLDNKNDEAVDVYILIFPFKNSITSGFKKNPDQYVPVIFKK